MYVKFFMFQIAKEVTRKLESLPDKEHIPLGEYTCSLAIKGISQASFGSLFKDEKDVLQLKNNYDIVSTSHSL